MGVDIETYSSVDLGKSGVRPYTEAPDFTILLIAYKVDAGVTRIIDLADNGEAELSLLTPVASDLPEGDRDEFLCLLTDPAVTKTAYNAAFERTCLARYFGKPMPPEQWRCTMVHAATLGLPGTLGQVGAALGLDRQKMTEGADLIRYFCKPTKDGVRHYSSHSRGNTVDVTLMTLDGEIVEMPTGFDDFSSLADRDYSDVPEVAAQNALLLETVMTDCGFKPYSGEWWHFSDTDAYPVEESFVPD